MGGSRKPAGGDRLDREPTGHGESEVILHGLAFDHFGGVVLPEREVVLRIRAFVLDLLHFGEVRHNSVSIAERERFE